MVRLLEVVARLRGPDGCPWDRKQTLASLKPYLIEESYEVLDAIDEGDPGHHCEELGDVLLQVVLQSQICSEKGDFAFDDVADGIAEKLIRRHPHVFGDVDVANADEVVRNWEAIKAEERAGEEAPRSIADGIPRQLPSLRRAETVQARAARVGFDWSDIADVVRKVEEELGEVQEALASGNAEHVHDELGDLFFALVNLCRFRQVDAESALESTIRKFTRRFHEVERRIHADGLSLEECTLEQMDAHWDQIKAEEKAD